jgi:hypothetical protein
MLISIVTSFYNKVWLNIEIAVQSLCVAPLWGQTLDVQRLESLTP